MTSDRVIVIRKTAALGPSDRPLEIVYSGSRLPSNDELARLNATPGRVLVLEETVVELDDNSDHITFPMATADWGTVTHFALTIDKLPLLFPGDQLFVRREIRGPVGEWLVAFLIRVATFTRKDKRPTVFNHVATVIRAVREIDAITPAGELVSSGPIVDYVICEALGEGGVQLRRLLAAYGDAGLYSIAIARRRTIQRQRAKIVRAELSLVGRPYGYAKIGAHVADYGLTWLWNLAGGPGDVYAFRWLCRMERYPMCSWKSLYSYRKAGLDFETALSTGSPDDLADECLRKPAVWHWPFISSTIRDDLLAPGIGDDEGRTE